MVVGIDWYVSMLVKGQILYCPAIITEWCGLLVFGHHFNCCVDIDRRVKSASATPAQMGFLLLLLLWSREILQWGCWALQSALIVGKYSKPGARFPLVPFFTIFVFLKFVEGGIPVCFGESSLGLQFFRGRINICVVNQVETNVILCEDYYVFIIWCTFRSRRTKVVILLHSNKC